MRHNICNSKKHFSPFTVTAYVFAKAKFSLSLGSNLLGYIGDLPSPMIVISCTKGWGYHVFRGIFLIEKLQTIGPYVTNVVNNRLLTFPGFLNSV